MGRQTNDGRGRMGGRVKGTKNKQLETLNEWITGVIDRNRKRFEKDLEEMEPAQRAGVLATLIAAAPQQVGTSTPEE